MQAALQQLVKTSELTEVLRAPHARISHGAWAGAVAVIFEHLPVLDKDELAAITGIDLAMAAPPADTMVGRAVATSQAV